MLKISILSVRASVPSELQVVEFDERGGTIGRDAANHMVLSDPERHLSRVQALIKCQGGEYLIIDQGGNPSSVNGRPLGKGNSSLLQDGDRIEMAEYVLGVELVRKAPSFLGAADAPPASVSVRSEPLPAPEPLGTAVPLSPLFEPPASSPAVSNGTLESVDDVFSALMKVAPPAVATEPAGRMVAARSAQVDDPFAVFAMPSAAQVKAPAPSAPTEDPFAFAMPAPLSGSSAAGVQQTDDPLGIGLGAASPETEQGGSVDSLFGLGSQTRSADLFANPLLGESQATALPGLGGGGADTSDPLALLMGAPASSPGFEQTARNDAAILSDAFIPPAAISRLQLDPEVSQPLPSAAPEPVAGAAFLFGEAPTEPVEMPSSAHEFVVPRPVPPENTKPAMAVPAFPDNGSPVQGSAQALVEAFVQGLAVDGFRFEGAVTPALMQQIGQVLSESVRGTMELLAARAATKREVRADVTMIVSKNNNPLKFSPDVGFALTQLLQPRTGSGFMGPAEAMRDAYDDLRAHQIGFVAGMRAALSGVLARFKPDSLEGRLSEKSFLDSVLPANRKAKLWDLYEQRYAEISREAEDDFHSLFGREFLRAYEEQIQRLQSNSAD